jgi:hypothetical protein
MGPHMRPREFDRVIEAFHIWLGEA